MRLLFHRSLSAALFLAGAAMLCGCPKSSGSGGSNGSGGGSGMRIAVIPKGTAHSYWQAVKAGADAAGKKDGVQIIWQGPSNEADITGQINIVNDQIDNGVNGIVLAACDENALVAPVQRAISRGIPVVTIDSGLAKAKDPSYCYIATDNRKGGALAADQLATLMGNKGKVGVLGFLQGAASNDQRVGGFTQEIQRKYPQMTIVSTLYDDSDATKAVDRITNMLTAHPDIGGVFAANEPGGVGAGTYLQQRGLSGKVKLVAFDTSDDEIRDLKQGLIQALIVQNPYQMGYQGVEQVLQAIKKQPAAQKYVDSGVTVVTQQNLNTPAVQKLLNPGAG